MKLSYEQCLEHTARYSNNPEGAIAAFKRVRAEADERAGEQAAYAAAALEQHALRTKDRGLYNFVHQDLKPDFRLFRRAAGLRGRDVRSA